jgi:dihydrodipicolinate synthase/N-acetylneuraminate lyase
MKEISIKQLRELYPICPDDLIIVSGNDNLQLMKGCFGAFP